VDHFRPLILWSVAQILLRWKGIDDLISAVDQDVDGWGRAGVVAARLGRGGGSKEPSIARAMGHYFWWGLTLRTQRSEGYSPRGPSSGRGDQSTVRDGSWLAPTFGVIDNELQWSADNEIRLRGGSVMCRRAMWHWFGAVRTPTERWWARAVVRVSLFANQDSS
jgi:hypothetical protein